MCLQYCNTLNILNSTDNRAIPTRDEVTLSLTIIMLLWRNGADPMMSYKLGEKDIFPADVDNNCPIVTLLLSEYSFDNAAKLMYYEKEKKIPL